MILDETLRHYYLTLWRTMKVLPSKVGSVDPIVSLLLRFRARYEAMERATGVPWYVIAAIDELEGEPPGCRSHLHNGDPLNKRTVHEPKGRPPGGKPPFTWEQSAVDALTYDGLNKWPDWGVAGTLYKLEGFNGYGYHNEALTGHKGGVPSPYLWSFSNHGVGVGKFTRDHHYDPHAVSDQCGAAVILHRMAEREIINLDHE